MTVSNWGGRARCVVLGEYLIHHQATVRSAAAVFGVSKSTVHKDLTYKLRLINPSLHAQVADVLRFNKSERHLRGGEATKQKYLQNRERKKG